VDIRGALARRLFPLTRLEAVPSKLASQAHVVVGGVKNIRYRVGAVDRESTLASAIVESWDRERAWLASQGHTGGLPPTAFLALSGGGDNGAFGAGLLNGWTAAGNRPDFKLVTGISTGALIAPFAFLGPAYDATLKDFYTTTRSEDILKARTLLTGLRHDAMADTGPLRVLLRKFVNRGFLDAIAAEYHKGRELWIATTELDHLHRCIWNMGRIATSPASEAVELFISLMIASAAVPGQFPPVLIDVEAAGKRYQEMHVDGGATAQVFVYPVGLDFAALAREQGADRVRSLYVIRNSRLDPEWAQIERRTFTIAARAISALIHTQGVGDLYRIYLEAQRDGLDFNLAYIPPSFDAPHPGEFDIDYMRALFALGYEEALGGYAWSKTPPGYQERAAEVAAMPVEFGA
jgi:predicted acylesterase/phospholipase RssA